MIKNLKSINDQLIDAHEERLNSLERQVRVLRGTLSFTVTVMVLLAVGLLLSVIL